MKVKLFHMTVTSIKRFSNILRIGGICQIWGNEKTSCIDWMFGKIFFPQQLKLRSNTLIDNILHIISELLHITSALTVVISEIKERLTTTKFKMSDLLA